MIVHGFNVKFSGFNFNPKRSEVLSILKAEVKNNAHGFTRQWDEKTFAEKCNSIQDTFCFDTIFIDAVRGSHLGMSK